MVWYYQKVVFFCHLFCNLDDSRAYNDLPWQAKLNCDSEQMAGASCKCQICHDTLLKGYNLPTGHIALLEIDGNIITSHVATAIKEASYRREFTEYITQRAGWQDKETHHTIDWVACSRAGKQLSLGQGLTVFKLEFALFATMSQHHRMEQGIDHRCPRCQHFQETLVHVFQCPRASDIRTGALTRALTSICKNLHAHLSLTCWSQGFPSGLQVGRFNGQAYLQVPQMTLVRRHSKHSRNNNKLDGTKVSEAGGVRNGVKQMDLTVSVGCIKEIRIYMLGGCLVW